MLANNPGSTGSQISHIHGINCDVNNCYYNEQHMCTSKNIKVGPQYAASTADTVCDTFRPR